MQFRYNLKQTKYQQWQNQDIKFYKKTNFIYLLRILNLQNNMHTVRQICIKYCN